MKTLKLILASLVLGVAAYIARNFSFQFHQTVIYLDSIFIGIVLGYLGSKHTWKILIAPFIVFAFIPPFIWGVFLPLTDYVVSFIPMAMVAVFTYRRRYGWAAVTAVLYLPVVWGVIFYYLESSWAFENPPQAKLSELSLKEIKSGNSFQGQEKQDAYLLTYWHRGCGNCIVLENELAEFETNHPELNLQIMGVETQGESYEELGDYIEKWHAHFPNYQDENRFIQEATDLNGGPILVLADSEKNIREIYIGFYRDLYWYGDMYLNYKINSFD